LRPFATYLFHAAADMRSAYMNEISASLSRTNDAVPFAHSGCR